MANLQQRFGKLVAAHRRQRGWTQRQLAEATELSDDMIAKIEVGGTGASFPTIERIAGALEVDPAELFTSELAEGAFQRGHAAPLLGRIAGLRPEQVAWLSRIIDACLAPRS
jgi:transcriptional regulator with XRE-family HTH domain